MRDAAKALGALCSVEPVNSGVGLVRTRYPVEIERSLKTLTERQKEVICYFFGIGVDHPMSLEDIGEKFSLTRERVRQIKDKAITKLRTVNRCKLLRTYLGG